MIQAANQFEETTRCIVDELADVLDAPVVAVDDWSHIIAAQDPLGVLSEAIPARESPGNAVRIPLDLSAGRAEVLIGPGPDGALLPPHLARALVEQALRHALLLGQHATRLEMRNTFLLDVLERRITDAAAIERHGGMLGLHFVQGYRVLLLDAANYVLATGPGFSEETSEGRVRQRAQVVSSHLAGALRTAAPAIQFYSGHGEFVIFYPLSANSAGAGAGKNGREPTAGAWSDLEGLKRIGQAVLGHLRQALPDSQSALSMGLGRHYPGVANLARAYEEARFALRLGARLYGPGRVHAVDTLGVAAFVAESPAGLKRDLATHLLAPLRAEAILRETLAVFFAQDGEIESSAARLGVHRNTLRQRLDRVQALTGLNPRRLDDALQIRCALLLEAGLGESVD